MYTDVAKILKINEEMQRSFGSLLLSSGQAHTHSKCLHDLAKKEQTCTSYIG